MSTFGQFFNLYSDDIGSIDAATERFGREKGLLVARPGRFVRPWFCIPEGFYALVQRFGKDVDHPVHGPVWPAGMYWGYGPWWRISNLISKQSVCFNMPVKEVMTQDNMPVEIDLALVFRVKGASELGEDPRLVRNFVYRVSPSGLQQQLTDACEEATRSVARTLLHTEVYGLRMDVSGKQSKVIKGAEETVDEVAAAEGEAANFTVAGPSSAAAATAAMAKGRDVAADMERALNDQFEQQGVQVTDVIITGVKLKEKVVQQMSEKTMVIAQLASQKMTQEFQMLTTKQDEEIATLQQRKKEEREKELQTGDKSVTEIQVQLDKMRAETQVRLNKIRQETDVHLQEIIADGELAVTKLRQQKDLLLSEKIAQASKDAAQMKAETDVFEQTRMSEARLTATRNHAKEVEQMAQAEGVAAPYVEARKQFETRQKQLKVWEALAKNQELVISGETDSDMNTLLLSDAIMNDKTKDGTKAQMLADMLILQRGSKVVLGMQGKEDVAAAGAASSSWR